MHGAYKRSYFAISKCPAAFAITIAPLGQGPEGVREVGGYDNPLPSSWEI